MIVKSLNYRLYEKTQVGLGMLKQSKYIWTFPIQSSHI